MEVYVREDRELRIGGLRPRVGTVCEWPDKCKSAATVTAHVKVDNEHTRAHVCAKHADALRDSIKEAL